MTRSLWSCALVLVVVGCQQAELGPSLRRVRVRAPVGSQAIPALDRDTSTRVILTGQTTFTLQLAGGATRLRELKLHSPRNLELSALGHSERFPEISGWTTVTLDVPLDNRTVTVTLTPLGAEGSVAELELWGEGMASVPEEPPTAREGSNLVIATARYGEATIAPKSRADGNSCTAFEFSHDVLTSDVRRAWLTWAAEGAAHVEALKVALNDAPLREGLWLDASGTHTLVEELDPRDLKGLNEVTHLCLPDDATRSVTVREVRLLLAVDDGAHWFDRDASRRLQKALDGDEKTSEPLLAGPRPFGLQQAVRLDRVGVGFQSGVSSLNLEVGEPGARQSVTFQSAAALTLKKVSSALTKEVGVSAEGAVRPGVPLAAASELLLLGSPEGFRHQGHQLVLAHPQTQRFESDGVHAGHYDGAALVAGWAISESGNGRVTLDDAVISSSTGAFSIAVRRPALQSSPWRSTLKAAFPDGVTRELTLIFDIDLKDTVGSQGVTVAPDSVLFGAENQTATALIGPAGGSVTLGERVGFSAPAGALTVPTSISITRAMPEVVPRLDPGMVNVTAPANAGYRFGPKGQQFAVPARIMLPYDSRLLPEGMSVAEIQTWYYDEATERWASLIRKDILHATQQVVSETTHFTFMINAVLVTPEHAEPSNFNPNSLKDLKAASPAEGIDLVELADPGNQGTARLQLPIRLPKARGEFQPQLALTYDSNGGNGFLGVGWSLSTSSISLDTRFGVPGYDASDRYLLDGAALVSTGLTAACRSGETGLRFALRVEGDFALIVRCGVDAMSYRFEVTSKTGVVFVYGPDGTSRLTSYLDQNIAEWHLAQVIDRHGNVARYFYDIDQRNPGDARNKEDFRFVYPVRLEYGGIAGSPFIVDLRALRGVGSERPDPTSSARYGFKTLLRRRLGSVVVRFKSKLIREYALSYQAGDFGKSVLKDVQLSGEGGRAAGQLFSSHTFDYSSNADAGFTFEEWTLQDPDADRLSAATDISFGIHTYGGIGFSLEKSTGSVGLRLGFNHREQTSQATFIDVNGDRIPDRLTKNGVLLGDSTNRFFRRSAPASDPAFGSPVLSTGHPNNPLKGLGKEVGNALNAAIQAQFSAFSANLGASVNFSDSSEFLTDADGDGLVDYVGGGEVLFNQPRGQPLCTLGQFCFDDAKSVGQVTFKNVDGGSLLALDAFRSDAGAQALAKFSPNDALVEWIAPFGGTIGVSGELRYSRPQPPGTPSRDGVRLRVYSSNMRDAGALVDLVQPYGATAPSPLSLSGLQVQGGDHLYFRLSTGADFPVEASSDGGGANALEEVHFVPRIEYQCAAAGCRGIVDSTGSLLYTSDLQADFRLAGRPAAAVQPVRSGKMLLTWTVNKPVMADQLRMCAVRHSPFDGGGVGMRPRSCDEGEVIEGGIIAAGIAAAPYVYSTIEDVTAGEQLVFRAETRVGVDLRGVSARVSGVMTEVCAPNLPCRTTTGDEQKHLRFEVDAQLPVHADLGPNLLPLPEPPLEGYVIPKAGELRLSSRFPAQACISRADLCAPITFSVRTATRQLIAHGEGGSDSANVAVLQGDRLFIEAHSEIAQTISANPIIPFPIPPVAALPSWALTATLRTPEPDGGFKDEVLDLPKRRTYERLISDRTDDRVAQTVLSGGYHGWFYGTWGAQADETLDLDLLEGKTPPYQPPGRSEDGGINDGGIRDIRQRAASPESYERRRARLMGVMVPKANGTLVFAPQADGGVERGPGLKPEVAAFVSTDSTAWVAEDGTWHAARKGGYIESGRATTSVEASFDIGPLQRSSFGVSASTGVGIGPLTASFSLGTTEQSLDLMDMNGDGIVDVVSQDGIRLTNRKTLRGAPGDPLRSDAGFLRTNDDLGMAFGLGLSSPVIDLSAKGNNRGQKASVAANLGGGLGLNLGISRGELMDINADGLPDMVRREGQNIVVRLNLGGQFGEPDLHFVGDWAPSAGGTSGFVGTLTPDPVESDDDAGAQELNAITSLMSTLTTEEQLRRSVTASFNANLGVTFQESYGVSANIDTSLSGTEVTMLDVTGDGLPDYVRRSPKTDGGISSILVKVNLGGSFSSERELAIPAWPANAGPNFVFPGGDPGITGLMRGFLGAGGESLLEANGSHTRIPGFGFVVTIPIPLTIVGTPVLLISAGADVSPERASGFEMGFQDIDGDGFADHVLKTDAKENPANPGTQSRVFVRRNEMGGGNLLRVVHRPLGGRINLEYVRGGNTVAMPESRWVLLHTTLDDGTNQVAPGHQLRTDWAFTDGVFDRAEREFFGFGSVKSTTADGTAMSRQYDTSGFERKGLLTDQQTRNRAGVLLVSTHNVYESKVPQWPAQAVCTDATPFFLDPSSFCSSFFVGLKSTDTKQFEGTAVAKVSRQTYEYDRFGNVSHFVDEGDIETPEDDLNATVEYTVPGLPGLPVTISVHSGRAPSGPLLRKRVGRYDTNGDLVSLLSSIDTSATAETGLEWHPNGNLAAVISPPNEEGQRYRIAYEYDDMESATWPVRISDSFGYASTAKYAPEYGQTTRTTDINGQTTTRQLDVFGRTTSITGPKEQLAGHPTITIAYSGPVAVTSNLLPDGAGQTRRLNVSTFIDGLGRVTQTKATARVEAQGLGMIASGAQEFDVLGRVVAQGQPAFTQTPPAQFAPVPLQHPTRFTFDDLGRTTTTTEANGALTVVEYRLEAPPGETLLRRATRTTDARGNERSAYRDTGGRVVAVTENVDRRHPTTRYVYSPVGELLTVTDAAGNQTRMTHDLLGRRLSLANLDTGLHTSAYDAAGNLVDKVTPRLRQAGKVIHYIYDYNRLTDIDYPVSEDVSYEYGPAGAPNGGAGRVVKVLDAIGVEKREYGPLGELIRQTRTVRPLRPGDRAQEFTLGFEWDSFGRALKVRYPDGELLQYQYDEGGLLKKAVGIRASESEVYLADVGYDEFGQRVRAEYGNGVVTKYTHAPATRRLETLTSTLSPVAGGTTFQALVYGYDPVGNVASLTNALTSPVSTPFGGAVKYVYGYDELNRLTSATGKAATRPGVDDTFAAGWDYSDIHNLERATLARQVTSMTGTERPPSDTRDETYTYEAAHPHRAKTIGTLRLEYDDDGNTVRECEGANCAPGRSKTFVWDEEGRMEEANARGRLVRFRYDADGQRMVKLAAGGPSFTFGQWWTMSGNSHATKHVFAGAGRVATKMIPAAAVQANTPPPDGMVGWPNTNGCIPSGDQPQKCPTNSNGAAWVERGVARPATWYYHSDSLGSTQWLTDDDGKLHERVEYYPYGEVWRQSSGQGVNRLRQAFLYTGKEYDSETGLTYFGARYYDSRHALWLSSDPAYIPQLENCDPTTLSSYKYGRLSPLGFVDPDGREDEDQGVRDAMAFRQWQNNNTQQGLAEVKPVAEAVAQTNPLIAAGVAVTGEQATGGKATYAERIIAAVGPVIGLLKVAKGFYSGARAAKATVQAERLLLSAPRQLQSKFKHASDFGIAGNYSKAKAAEFSLAIEKHVNNPGVRAIEGTYHQQPVVHYLEQSTGLNVMTDTAGNFISGWKLSPGQLENVLKHGGL